MTNFIGSFYNMHQEPENKSTLYLLIIYVDNTIPENTLDNPIIRRTVYRADKVR